jgi:hypothetical protein
MRWWAISAVATEIELRARRAARFTATEPDLDRAIDELLQMAGGGRLARGGLRAGGKEPEGEQAPTAQLLDLALLGPEEWSRGTVKRIPSEARRDSGLMKMRSRPVTSFNCGAGWSPIKSLT